MSTPHACPEEAFDRASLGFHPLHVNVERALADMGGPKITTVARPISIPRLPEFIPQIRFRADTGVAPHPVIGIRIDQVLLQRGVHTAADVRAHAGLHTHQPLMMLGFAEDEVLEQLWADPETVRQVARAGFDLVVAPSFSLWHGRPRSWHLHSLKRSFIVYEELQKAGIAAIPRVGFVVEKDAERLADWCNANPCVDIVALDLMTLRQDDEWLEHADLMVAFDDATGRRLRFLVNGTATLPRLVYLFRALGDRLHLTDARAVAQPPIARQPPVLAEAGGLVVSPSSFEEHVKQSLALIEIARQRAGLLPVTRRRDPIAA